MSLVLSFHAGQRLSPIEQEMVGVLRASHDPDAVVAAARGALDAEQPKRLTMEVERLAKGPRRTFWQEVRGGYQDYSARGAEFEVLEDVIAEAVANLGDLDQLEPTKLACEPHKYQPEWDECFLYRGDRYRVKVNGLPVWMAREWQARTTMRISRARGGE